MCNIDPEKVIDRVDNMFLCGTWQNFTLLLLLAAHVLCATGSFWKSCKDEATSNLISTRDKLESRIVGGEAAKQRQFPYQVSIRRSGWTFSHFCGGSILDEKHVLTAAHCVKDLRPRDISIVAGDILLDRSSCTSVRLSVKDIFVHENYTKTLLNNDIAVLRVAKEFPKNKPTIQMIRLAKSSTSFNFSECQISGWGSMKSQDPTLPNELRYANVNLYSKDFCRGIFHDNYFDGMICASGNGTDACQGDSGGPLQCDSLLVGIVSWGIGCAQPQYPGVYTDVSHYEDWVKAQLVRPSRGTPGTQPLFAVWAFLFFMVYQLSLR